MDADGLPLIGAGIDFLKVEPIPHKRSLACINHFIMHTIGFLNRFSSVCEEKLEDLSIRIQRLETTLDILEGKLSSIPGLETVTVATASQSQPNPAPVAAKQDEVSPQPPSAVNGTVNSSDTPSDASNLPNGGTSSAQNSSTAIDPRYAKFFSMLKLGIVKGAVMQKMVMEGLDPSILDNPSAAMTPVAQPSGAEATAKSENNDGSDFSDSDSNKDSDSLSDSSNSSNEDLDD